VYLDDVSVSLASARAHVGALVAAHPFARSSSRCGPARTASVRVRPPPELASLVDRSSSSNRHTPVRLGRTAGHPPAAQAALPPPRGTSRRGDALAMRERRAAVSAISFFAGLPFSSAWTRRRRSLAALSVHEDHYRDVAAPSTQPAHEHSEREGGCDRSNEPVQRLRDGSHPACRTDMKPCRASEARRRPPLRASGSRGAPPGAILPLRPRRAIGSPGNATTHIRPSLANAAFASSRPFDAGSSHRLRLKPLQVCDALGGR